jgi:hypothetical protein
MYIRSVALGGVGVKEVQASWIWIAEAIRQRQIGFSAIRENSPGTYDLETEDPFSPPSLAKRGEGGS